MIIDQLKRLLITPQEEPASNMFTGSDTDALFSAMGCENMPVFIPSEVWQRVIDLECDVSQTHVN
ncbi:hypothetical protein SJI19_12635 [Acerihabitans sp. TG2]|uniref:hypothetical protein n=1 Tax=Acerihabitans sp. TG2 TaxID=3096008 RepID=UPI002B22B851|nr:hypothetical protein [Acerihabitans sp. TG2]MEA9391379.1 hypothetical protein [Acerihabitans sp. TG2]